MDDIERTKRKALFVPCQSKDSLKRWIKIYLGLDIPDTILCDDDTTTPPSNSSPMDLLWEIYHKALDGKDEDFQTVLAYAARDSYKTLSAAVMEVLCLFHLRRSVAHMAAIESQAAKAVQYVDKFLRRPILRDFVTSNNKRTVEITRYDHVNFKYPTLSKAEYDALDISKKGSYTAHSYYIKVVIATMAGANSEHVPFMVLDELDLAPPKPVEEAQMIPSQGENGEVPITLMISSRKFAFGLVQKALDEAESKKTIVRHWNLLDVTKKCEPTRHLPEEPKIPIYYNENTLAAINEADFKLLSPETQSKYKKAEGFAGCLKNCSLFASCKGRLATKPVGDSKLYKSVAVTKGVFHKVTAETAKAQLLCWKPSSEGLIYPHFDRTKHVVRARAMAELITGELPKSPFFSKADLINLMKARGMSFHLGMDFGFTHNFATVLAGLDGHRLFIFDVQAVAGLELNEKIGICKPYLDYDPTVYPDPAYPSDIKSFRRAGFRCKTFTKDILAGIDSVRIKLMPGGGKEPELFILGGDEGCELLVDRVSKYHWVLDDAGRPTDVPDDSLDDEVDALRYLCQNLFGPKGKPVAASINQTTITQSGESTVITRDNWMVERIRTLTDGNSTSNIIKGKKGSFIFEV
jgi:hypothetical protein